MAVQILFRRGLAADWTSVNPVLASGEPGHETDTGRFKLGNGSSTWTALAYADSSSTVTNLADLADVTSTTPSNGQVLKWNGAAWAPAADADTNTNTTYTVSAEVATGGADIRLTGSDTTADAVKIAAGANVTVTRTDASTITIASAGGGGTATLSGLTDVNVTTPSNGQVLKYNGTSWVNGTDLTGAGGAVALDELTDVIVTTPTSGQVLKYNGTSWVNGTDLNSGGGGTLATRAQLAGSTTSLANGASGNITITGYSAYALLKIQTSAAAWVRIYISDAARTADTARLQGTDPAPGAGVIAEVITTGAETVIISPGAFGFNNEVTVTTAIPVRVTNLSGSSADITVTLTAIQLEA